MREFSDEEYNKYEDSTYVNSVTLFQERQIEEAVMKKALKQH